MNRKNGALTKDGGNVISGNKFATSRAKMEWRTGNNFTKSTAQSYGLKLIKSFVGS